jgi:hypothetical protein
MGRRIDRQTESTTKTKTQGKDLPNFSEKLLCYDVVIYNTLNHHNLENDNP